MLQILKQLLSLEVEQPKDKARTKRGRPKGYHPRPRNPLLRCQREGCNNIIPNKWLSWPRYLRRKYCSHKCRGEANNARYSCNICGQQFKISTAVKPHKYEQHALD